MENKNIGRPPKLDDLKRGQVCGLVAAGCSLAAASRFVGCSVHTLRREIVKNADFRQQIRNAELQLELEPLRAMKVAASQHWRAAAWLLERTRPRQFGKVPADSLRPEDFDHAILDVVETATEIVADPKLRREICRGLLGAARTTTATRAPGASLHSSAEDRPLAGLIEEADRNDRDALRRFRRQAAKPASPEASRDPRDDAHAFDPPDHPPADPAAGKVWLKRRIEMRLRKQAQQRAAEQTASANEQKAHSGGPQNSPDSSTNVEANGVQPHPA